MPITLETDHFIFFEGLPDEVAEKKLNAVPTRKGWRLPKNVRALRELYKIMPDEQILTIGKAIRQKRDKLLSIKTKEDTDGDPRLRPYQRVDVEFLKHLPNGALFNEPRTGKTPTILCLLKEKGYERIGIVVPAYLVSPWAEEIRRWMGREPDVIRGDKKKRTKIIKSLYQRPFVFVTSYETLRMDLDQYRFLKLDAMVVDEAHRLRNYSKGKPGTKQNAAVFTLSMNASHRYALTGTPSVRSPEDIWPILHFLEPDKYPGKWAFIDRYFEQNEDWLTKSKVVGEIKREAELQEEIALIATNRKLKEVMPWVPEKQYMTVKLELHPSQRKAYESVAETFEYVEDGKLKIDCPSILAQMIRLRQICTCPQVLDLEVDNIKEQWLLDWLKDNPNEPVIVFSTFSSYLWTLQRILFGKGYGASILTGNLSQETRWKHINDFQSGKTNIILANIKAAGVGLTLDRATTTIFLDKEFNPADNEQAENRMVPISKERSHGMMVISLVAKDTWDEVIDRLLERKYNITEIINNGGVEALKRLYHQIKSIPPEDVKINPC